MVLKKLAFENIRNHLNTTLEPCNSINIFLGKNGAGKTSILEAISIACVTKSFVANYDYNIVTVGQNYYTIEMNAETEEGIPILFKVNYNKLHKKKEIINSDGTLVDARDHIGKIPIVILNPPMRDLIFGPPIIRREFVDRTISQVSRSYLDDLIRFKRIHKQRNKLLQDFINSGSRDHSLFEIWTEQFVRYASKIIIKRILFFNIFLPFFEQSLFEISGGREKANLIYKPFAFPCDFVSDEGEINSILSNQFLKYKSFELEKGITLFGPQKDDFLITINNNPAKEMASQGQSKSLLIALKYAEMKFLSSYKSVLPLLLLDDIFSELDVERIEQVMELISKDNVQTFITLTDLSYLSYFQKRKIAYQIFYVENGKFKDFYKSKEF
ncbi:MAG: DNA replication/repair protein RecF [Candidatus Kapaibacteriales bacterium]